MNDEQLLGIAQNCLWSVFEDCDAGQVTGDDILDAVFNAVVRELQYEEEMAPTDRIWAAIDVVITYEKEFHRLVDKRHKRQP